MSQENVATVRTTVEQFARGDFSWFADVTDDFEFITSPEIPDAGTYRGEAAQRWLMAWAASFEEHMVEITEIVDAGDHVFVELLQRGRPRGSQTTMERRWWSVVILREGVIAQVEVFAGRAQALDAAGLSE